MKIWTTYGSEHSMNLVLIGKFKEARDAENIEAVVKRLRLQAEADEMHAITHAEPDDQRFSEAMLKLVSELNVHILAPSEMGQFVSDHGLERRGDKITVTTDEADVSAFMKLFVNAGARVEIYSAHNYPDAESSKD